MTREWKLRPIEYGSNLRAALVIGESNFEDMTHVREVLPTDVILPRGVVLHAARLIRMLDEEKEYPEIVQELESSLKSQSQEGQG